MDNEHEKGYTMNQFQTMWRRMKEDKGFIAALDQSGGSTPKALLNYGIYEDAYHNDEEMFNLVHEMRTRIIKSKSFDNRKILGAILFKKTMDSEIDGKPTAKYLWDEKKIVPFLKIDNGLREINQGVQMMKPIPGLEELLEEAKDKGIFGTKMRSVIKEYNPQGIKELVEEQFEIAKIVIEHDLVPIIEPEVDINAERKEEIEWLLREEIIKELNALPIKNDVMLKLTLPEKENYYKELIENPKVLRVVALSGGYPMEVANEKLLYNEGMIASFSRALVEKLNVNLSDDDFDNELGLAINSIYNASIT